MQPAYTSYIYIMYVCIYNTKQLIHFARKKHSRTKNLKAVTCNVQSAKHVWTALQEYIGVYDVIMLQETKLTTEEYGQITARAEKHSYKVYMAEGLQTKNRWGQLTPLGGVVTMVRMEAKQKLVWEKKGENQQLLAVKVEEWTMINGYAPPHPNDKMLLAAMLQEMMISERLDQPETKMGVSWRLERRMGRLSGSCDSQLRRRNRGTEEKLRQRKRNVMELRPRS